MGRVAARVSEDEVRAVPEPAFTDTWHPVSHSRVIDAMQVAVKDAGLGVVNRAYSLGFEGDTLFGTWGLDEVSNDSQWMVGFRNSLNKMFSLGVCAGNNVLVCSNMVFRGDDFIEFRKHTSGLDQDELYRLARSAMKGLILKMGQLQEWQNMLKETSISEYDFKALTFDSMCNGILAPSEFNKFLACHEEEQKSREFPDATLYGFHGAVTRVLRDKNLFQISERTAKLVGLLTQFKAERPMQVARVVDATVMDAIYA